MPTKQSERKMQTKQEKKRVELQALGATNYHYRQMAENYDRVY
jgi:hypothetical protein